MPGSRRMTIGSSPASRPRTCCRVQSPCCPSQYSAVFCASSRHRLVRCSEIQGVSSRVCSVSRRCDDRVMASTTRIQRKYDHRLRELVRSTGDIEQRRERGNGRVHQKRFGLERLHSTAEQRHRLSCRLVRHAAMLSVTTFCSFQREFSPVPPNYSIRVRNQQLTSFEILGASGYSRQFSRLAMVRRWVS